MSDIVRKTQTERYPYQFINLPSSTFLISWLLTVFICRFLVFLRWYNFKIQGFFTVWGKFIFKIWGWKLIHFVVWQLGKSIIPPLMSIFSFSLAHQFYQHLHQVDCWRDMYLYQYYVYRVRIHFILLLRVSTPSFHPIYFVQLPSLR